MRSPSIRAAGAAFVVAAGLLFAQRAAAADPVTPAIQAVPADPSAPAPPTIRLTLHDAEAAALRDQPRVLAARGVAAEAGQLLRESRSPYYPTINAEATGSLGNRDARVGAGTFTASRLFNRGGAGLTLSQLITDSGRTPNLVAAARLHADATSQTLEAARAGVLLDVDRAYFEALQAAGLVKVAEQTLAARRQLEDQVTTLAGHKLKSQLDVSFAGVGVSEARLLKIRAQDRLGGAFAELTRAMGSDRPAIYELIDEPLPARPAADPELLVAQARAGRPDLLSLRLERDAAYRNAAAEKDLARPTVSLVGTGGALPWIGPDAATVPNHYEGAAVNVEIPLFNGHLFAARRSAARFRAETADQRVRALEEGIASDVRSAWASASTAFQRIDVTAGYIRQARLALDLAQGRYDLGLSSIVELTQAQLNLTQAQIEDLAARYDYASQNALLRYTVGGAGAPAPAAP